MASTATSSVIQKRPLSRRYNGYIITMQTTPFFCDACLTWIPRKPDSNLFGDRVSEKIVVGGICQECSADGWDYDVDLQIVRYKDAL